MSQSLVLRGTRLPPSCKWALAEIGVLRVPVGMRTPTETRRTLLSHGVSLLVHIPCFYHKNLHKSSSRCYFSQLELISGVKMHIFRQEIWCIEHGGADSILRMGVLTIRDVFILNFAPVSLSVSPPGPREFVMHFNSRRQIIAVLVRLRHKIWVACKAKSAPLPKNWLEASTAHGTLFTSSSPRSQHSGSSKSSHLRNLLLLLMECLECQCTCGQYSLKGRPTISMWWQKTILRWYQCWCGVAHNN